MYGSTARVLRRGGGVKFFRWGVSPSKKAQGTAIYIFSYTSVYSNQRHLHLRRPPFLPYGRQYNTTYSTYTNGKRTNRIRPGRSIISLSFPTLPKQPGLTARYSALLYTLIHLLLEIGNRGPRLGPQDKVPRFISSCPAILLGWKSCYKQEDYRRIHTDKAFRWEQGQTHKTLQQSYGNLQSSGSMARMADRAR